MRGAKLVESSSIARDVQPVRSLRDARPYERKASLRPIDLRLDANEGGAFAAEVIGALEADPELLRRYPDAHPLEATVASRLGIDTSRVVVTAGADDALARICAATLEPGRSAAYCTPTFEMLRRYVRASGAGATEVPWPSGALPVEQLIEAGRDASVVFVVSPNNPTGTVATAANLVRLRDALPGTLLVLDAAYAEFADEDLTELALSMPWTVVTRTLSKSWSAAGLRVGYAAGDARAIAWLRAVGQPYAVGAVSLASAAALLGRGDAAADAYVARVREERAELTELLRTLDAQPVDGQANFVLARLRDAPLTADLLEGLGIAVRRFPAETGLGDALRIGCPGDADAFARLTRACRAALRPQALLLDLDGVVADVSNSYRAAIVQTAAALGARVTPADVAAAKAAGNANNDWVVTQRLLAQRGIEVPLDRVTDVFEQIYQGSGSEPGLCENEPLLIPVPVLRSLRARYRLAIVTGRPRADAARFLRRHDVAGFFDAVVCMEDAPLKPSPRPVRLALELLGVQHAWMLGDTPDDVRAARDAGVVPVACLAPGETRHSVEEVLLRAGAARVLDTPQQILEILP